MDNKILKVILISSDTDICIKVESLINEINTESKINIEFYQDSTFIDNINPQLIIIDGNNKEELIRRIEEVKIQSSLTNGYIVALLDNEYSYSLSEVIDVGAIDYISKPWSSCEAKIRLKNIINFAFTKVFNKDTKHLNIGKLLMKNIPFAMWIIENNGRINEVNEKFSDFTNKSRDELIGENLYDIFNNAESRSEDYRIINNKDGLVLKKDVKLKGVEKSLEIYKSPIFDENNEVIGIIGLMRDITEIRKAHNDIKKLVYTDYLTDLPNRQGLYNYVDANINNTDTYISLLFIDLDNFKKLNDTYGSHFGDQVLLAIAENLKAKCSKDFVARVGGDEFVIIAQNITDKDKLKIKVDEVFNTIKIDLQDNLNVINVIPSIGVVSGYIKEISLEKLMMQGDLALLKAKELGKSRVVFYTDELEAENTFSKQIEEDLKNAISNNEIVLFYQPQFNTKKELKGFESLFRWKNEKYSKVPVIDVIKIIESRGLIGEIGSYIIEQAAIFAKKVNELSSEDLTVSINISAIQLMDDLFLSNFVQIIERINMHPKYLAIELTETVLLQDMDKNIEKLNMLRKMGITISLDDFGTGYSSLNYLVKLPISELKIDKSFVQSMNAKDEYITLIKLMTDIGHILKLKVVAEGVEENDQLEILDNINVDYIQGYLFSKPLPEEEAIKFIK